LGGGSLYGYATTAVGIYQNAYENSGWKYVNTATASGYEQYLGAHTWYNAASGTAGNAITFTQAMTLDASGNLGIGRIPGAARLDLEAASGQTKIILRNVGNTVDASTYVAAETGSSGDWANLSLAGRHAIRFLNNGTENMRLDSNGNLGIGVSPSNTKLHVYANWVGGHSTVKLQTPTSFTGGGTTGIGLYDSDGTRSSMYYHASSGSVIGSTVNKPFILTTNDLTRLTISAGGDVYTASRNLFSSMGNAYTIAAGGSLAFNIEALGGLFTSGILYVMGRENSLNQTIAVYTFNLSYSYVSNIRYIRLLQISRNTVNNEYGNVYAYVSSYAASWTSTDQSHSGTSTSISDIYFRNAVGAGCQVNYLIHFTGS
jgi:hypothetical protein